VLTGTSATAAATGAAGAAGTAAAAKATLGAAAAKIAVAVVGIAVVASATVIIVNTTGDDRPAVPQEALSVRTVTEQASYQVNVDLSAQVVRVAGVSDADELNAVLRAPVEIRVRELRDAIDGVRTGMRSSGDERWDDPATIRISATVLLRNADYLSVRYDNEPDSSLISNSPWQSYDTVTVDLRTGKGLTLPEIYRPNAATALAEAFMTAAPDKLCEDVSTGGTDLTLTPQNLDHEVKVAFTRDHASFTVELPALGRANACGIPTIDIPYGDLADVLDPTLVQGLTAG
jgi:serine/threonine-protein kinase